jgi:DNA-binding NarL/FixJ family response regulator
MMTNTPSPDHPETRPVRVLLVDDAASVRQELRQLLELAGGIRIVGEAANGADAVRLAAEVSPGVVVMDLEMPGMDGCEATLRIKSRPHAPRVVILTVHSGPDVEARIRAAKADLLVIKGSNYQTLLNAILGEDGSSSSVMKGEKS